MPNFAMHVSHLSSSPSVARDSSRWKKSIVHLLVGDDASSNRTHAGLGLVGFVRR
jgi:hypothetical protein